MSRGPRHVSPTQLYNPHYKDSQHGRKTPVGQTESQAREGIEILCTMSLGMEEMESFLAILGLYTHNGIEKMEATISGLEFGSSEGLSK